MTHDDWALLECGDLTPYRDPRHTDNGGTMASHDLYRYTQDVILPELHEILGLGKTSTDPTTGVNVCPLCEERYG